MSALRDEPSALLRVKEKPDAAKEPTAREKIAGLSDRRLSALSFKAWRVAETGSERARKKAARLRPLLRAEAKAREKAKAR